MAKLIAPPPKISHANSDAASANGLIPAVRIADTWVVTPSAAMAIASMTVSKLMPASTIAFRQHAEGVERRDSHKSEREPRNRDAAGGRCRCLRLGTCMRTSWCASAVFAREISRATE